MPIELCRLAPGVVNGKLNTLLEEIPVIIPFTTITAATGDDLLGDTLPLQVNLKYRREVCIKISMNFAFLKCLAYEIIALFRRRIV